MRLSACPHYFVRCSRTRASCLKTHEGSLRSFCRWRAEVRCVIASGPWRVFAFGRKLIVKRYAEFSCAGAMVRSRIRAAFEL